MKKKKKNALGWWQKLNAGDPEKNIEIFNHIMTDHPNAEQNSSAGDQAMGEAIESIRENPENNLEAMKALNLMDEKWVNDEELEKHFKKHCIGEIVVNSKGAEILDTTFVYYPNLKDKRQYEKEAEKLQETPIDNKLIKGYQAGDYYIKYNTKTQDFVVYIFNDDKEKRSISYYKLRGALEYIFRKNSDEAEQGFSRDLSIGEALKELNS